MAIGDATTDVSMEDGFSISDVSMTVKPKSMNMRKWISFMTNCIQTVKSFFLPSEKDDFYKKVKDGIFSMGKSSFYQGKGKWRSSS